MKRWKEVANILYNNLVQQGKIDPEYTDFKPEEYEDQQYDDWIAAIREITCAQDQDQDKYPNRYELIKEFPNRKIGDTAKYDPRVLGTYFHWEQGGAPIPHEFQPDVSDWFKLIT